MIVEALHAHVGLIGVASVTVGQEVTAELAVACCRIYSVDSSSCGVEFACSASLALNITCLAIASDVGSSNVARSAGLVACLQEIVTIVKVGGIRGGLNDFAFFAFVGSWIALFAELMGGLSDS